MDLGPWPTTAHLPSGWRLKSLMCTDPDGGTTVDTASARALIDLDAGDTCHAAHAADDLRAAVQESDLPANLRPGVDEVAGNLVDQVNCPPPPPAPPPEKKPEKPKDEDHGDQHNGDQHNGDEHQGGDNGPKAPGHGGKLPPGKAKVKGEPG
jgi:hypothetical protein